MKKVRLSIQEQNGTVDFTVIQFNENQNPVDKYLSQRNALNQRQNKPLPASVKLEEVL